MDGSFPIKPNAAVPKFTPRDRSPARPVETELGAAKSVTAAGEGGRRFWPADRGSGSLQRFDDDRNSRMASECLTKGGEDERVGLGRVGHHQ